MSYTILSARFGNPAGDVIVLKTREAGEVHVQLSDPLPGHRRNNEEAYAVVQEWLKTGTPAPFVTPPPPPASRDPIAEIDALKEKIAALEGRP